MHLTSATLLILAFAADPAPDYKAELVFDVYPQHNHAPGIVECPNGDLLASWYRGSGERGADDVAVFGSRKRKGEDAWCEPYQMADHPNFPDCNTCMMIDKKDRLWLFWPTIIANTWESCLTNYLVSSDYMGDGPPKWDWHGTIFLRPDDFSKEYLAAADRRRSQFQPQAPNRPAAEQPPENTDRPQQAGEPARGEQSPQNAENAQRRPRAPGAANRGGNRAARASDKLFQRLGWQPRCKPTVLPSGRILLPLYSDTFSISMMAVSDDEGRTWYASKPLIGPGNIQPAVLRRDDGTLVAYMRASRRIKVCESKDDGITWGEVTDSELPCPGSGLDGIRLANGHWLLTYNDSTRNRQSLVASISEDEGRTWKYTRHLEKWVPFPEQREAGKFHYPAVTQGRDGTIHVIYSYFLAEGNSMKHAAFQESWVKAGDPVEAAAGK
jgi:predicted neuraminidase